MKSNRNAAKLLAGHGFVISTFLVLVIGLFLENCLEIYNPIISRPEISIRQNQTSVELQEKQLLNKVFVSQGRYKIRFYKEAEIWKAQVKAIQYTTKYKYNLLAHLGSDKELEKNINRLAEMDPKTRLIQVVLPDKEQQGYVYIGGVEGGTVGNKKNKNKKRKREQSSLLKIYKEQKYILFV